MWRAPIPARLLGYQASVLRTQLRGVLDGDAEAVHGARVATRRIRELLTLLPGVPGQKREEEDVAAGFADIGRALGRVRDVDVQVALLNELQAHTPQAAPSLVLVRQRYERDRLENVRRLIKTLERVDVHALVHVIGNDHPAGLRTRLASAGWKTSLQRQLAERARAAEEAIAHATGVYFPNRVHNARIAIKRLRYAAEIMSAAAAPHLDGAIRRLSKAQTVLGNLHDRQTLEHALARFQKRDGVTAAHLKVTRQVLSSEVQALHARYLAQRTELVAACAEIERLAVEPSAYPHALTIGGAVAMTGLICAGWMRRQSSERASRSSSLPAIRASA